MAQPSQIILISGKDPESELGGHGTFVRAHGRAAIKAGFEPHVFCVSRTGGIATTDFGIVHRTKSPLCSFRQTTVPFHAPLLTRSIVQFLSGKPGPHLVHSVSLWGTAAIALERRMRRRGTKIIPIVSSYTTMEDEAQGKLRGLNSSHGLVERLRMRLEYLWLRSAVLPHERRTYRHSRLVLVNYDSVEKLVRDEFGSTVRFRKIAYAAESAFHSLKDIDVLVPEPLRQLAPRDAPLIVSVSRHDLRKGCDVLLRALAKLNSAATPFRACLVGPGALLEHHRRLACDLHLEANVLITGEVPDPLPYLQLADIFVLPSLEEGSGSVSLLEALQTHNACVVSGCDGLLEDVTDGRDALLVPPGNEGALARAMERLLRDPLLRRQLSDAGYATYERRFSVDALTRELGALYRELLDEEPVAYAPATAG